MIRPQRAPVLVVMAWLTAVGAAMALAAMRAVEPPPWDALSYVWKGFAFWQAVGEGRWVDPFSLPQTTRPPGTILMSYPFGFSPDFRWFYFRSVFLPLLLLAPSLWIAIGGPARAGSAKQVDGWALAGLTLALIGMPILYQFQASDSMEESVYWGMVDSTLAGVAALTAAAAMRSARLASWRWALAAAALAAFCLMIKPAGLVIMGLTGAVWFILAVSEIDWRARPWPVPFLAVSIVGAGVIYAPAVYVSFTSAYFSADNITFGKTVQGILTQEFDVALRWRDIYNLIHTSIGDVGAALTLLGAFMALAMRGYRRYGIGIALCLAAGLWFWLGQGTTTQVRYFLPFGAMAFVLAAPPLLAAVGRWSVRSRRIAAGLVALPAAAALTLLATPSPPVALQEALGVNLTVNAYGDEVDQARDLLDRLRRDGVERTSVYLVDRTGPCRAFQAVLEYEDLINPAAPSVKVHLPVDWSRSSAFRLDEIATTPFLAFELLSSEQERAMLLSQRTAQVDFGAETRLMRALLSTLDVDDGVEIVSETRLRLLRIVDPDRFGAALMRLENEREWTDAFHAANPKLWWSAQDLRTLAPDAFLDTPIPFARGDGATADVRLVALRSTPQESGLVLDLWVESLTGTPLPGAWQVFAHMLDGAGAMVGNQALPVARPAPYRAGTPLRRYTLSFPGRPREAELLGIGFYRVADDRVAELLYARGQVRSDLDGRRVLFSLPDGKVP